MKRGVVSLYRYYLMMRHRQSRFLHELSEGDWHKWIADNPLSMGFLVCVDPPSIYLALWQATLYVLIEGLLALGLSDPKLDELLKSENTHYLKLHRHGTFHFHRELTPQSYLPILSSPDAVEWTHGTSAAFCDYFNELSVTQEFREQIEQEAKVRLEARSGGVSRRNKHNPVMSVVKWPGCLGTVE